MNINSFLGIDNLLFSDNYKIVIEKLKTFKIEKGERIFMNKINLTLFIEELNLFIFFNNKSGDFIEYFEISKENVFFEKMNLMKLKYDFLLEYFKKNDSNLKIFNEEGFDSPKYGFGVYRELKNGKYKSYPKYIIVFYKDYLNKEIPSEEDILNFYLGDSYDPETEVSKWE